MALAALRAVVKEVRPKLSPEMAVPKSLCSLSAASAAAGMTLGQLMSRLKAPEGKALRAWLSTDRLRPEGIKGVSVPLPYYAYVSGEDPTKAKRVRPGSLDLVRMGHRGEGDQTEPDMHRRPGDSLSEWDWLEWEQIQLLRRECIVLVDSSGRA